MMTSQQLYPIQSRPYSFYEKLLCYSFPFFCPLYGKWTFSIQKKIGDDLREHLRCKRNGATNRNRQIGYIIMQYLRSRTRTKKRSLIGYQSSSKLKILNTEASGPIHNVLSKFEGYIASEFLGGDKEPGWVSDEGIRHEDMQGLSFENNSLDIIISSDVLEHVPSLEKILCETWRVLKPGGIHILTVPFYQDRFADEIRAEIDPEGNIIYKHEPQYHHDPLNPNGILVYRIWSMNTLSAAEARGFKVTLHKLYLPLHGIVGNNALVITMQKP